MSQLVFQILNGVAFGMLLFLLTAGLTVVFGLMGVINLSHGALYLLGGSIGIAVYEATGSWPLVVLAAVAAVAILGLALERTLRQRLYGDELGQVLVTFGVALVIGDLLLWAGGGETRTLAEPGLLDSSIGLLGTQRFPVYRLFLIAAGVTVALGLGLLWTRTRLGAMLRAGVDDGRTLAALGVNVEALFALTFAAGAGLAALAGVLGAPILSVHNGLDFEVLLLALVVVVIGGLGSLRGALAGSLIVGLADSLSKAYVPELASFAVFGPAIAVLALRPHGLFGRAAVAS